MLKSKVRSRKKLTLKQRRANCKKKGLVYDPKLGKCRSRKLPKKKSRVKKSRVKKSRVKKSRVKKSRVKKSRVKRKTVKQLRAECKAKGLVYDPKTKKCGRPKNISCDSLVGLRNIGGWSCYMDSVLFSLLFNVKPDDYVGKKLELAARKSVQGKSLSVGGKAKKQLRNSVIGLVRCIQGAGQGTPSVSLTKVPFNNKVYNLRFLNSLKGCASCPRVPGAGGFLAGAGANFLQPGQADASEFFEVFAQTFNMNGLKLRETTFGTNDLSDKPKKANLTRTSSITRTNDSVAYTISVTELLPHCFSADAIKLSSFLKASDDSGDLYNPDPKRDNSFKSGGNTYRRRLQTREVLDAPYLVFSVHRFNFIDNSFCEAYISPNKTIKLPERSKKLTLFAIVVHQGYTEELSEEEDEDAMYQRMLTSGDTTSSAGHYTAYFKCGSNWFYYDDLGPSITKVGSYNDMIQSDPDPETRGTLYFYK